MLNNKNAMLTMEDLVKYFSKHEVKTFSYTQSGKPIVVKATQDFSSSEIEESEDGKLYAKVRVCHTLLNRNGSYVSENTMKKAMPTLKYSPLLAKIHQLDNGEWDFHAHDYHIDENGDTVYDESQIGTFTVDEPYLEYDEEMDKTYVIARVAIPTEYTRAADIIKSKGGTKVSCELAIYSCSYNAKEKYLELEDFIFMGCACLGREKDGTEIGEGMVGSKLTLEDFSANDDVLNKIVELQERLSKLESTCFSIDTITRKEELDVESKNKFDEVTEIEEVTETEETTEEEITVTEDESEGTVSETPEESDETVNETSEEEVIETDVESDDIKTYSYNKEEIFNKVFEISFNEIHYALNTLCSIYRNDSEWCYVSQVYDDYFIMEDWDSDKFYKQSYEKDGDNISLVGERTPMFAVMVTESEKIALDEMRSNYAELVEFKETVEKNELHVKREEILTNEMYSSISDTEAFKKLVNEMDNYSLDDLEREAKIIFADIYKSVNFASSETKHSAKPMMFANVNKNKKTSRYGNLFSKK